MNPATIKLELAGPLRVRREPHQGRHGWYPDPATLEGVEAWRARWQAAGCPHIDGPIALALVAAIQRPPSHFTTKGDLSAAGRRQPIPKRCDLSNALKLVEDALKGRAFGDDALVCQLAATKFWDQRSCTFLTISGYTP